MKYCAPLPGTPSAGTSTCPKSSVAVDDFMKYLGYIPHAIGIHSTSLTNHGVNFSVACLQL